MGERIFYYFVLDTKTKERKLITTDNWAGDIGDHYLGDENLIIEDFAEELVDFEQTTDVDLSEYVPF